MRATLTALAAVGVSVSMLAGVQAKQVSIGSLPQGALGYAIAAAAASVITKHSDLKATAVPTGGSNIVLPQVNAGEMGFGTSNTIEAIYATKGTANFEGRPLKNISVAAVLTPFRVGIVVPDKSDVRTAADLKGRPFPTDYSAQRLVGFFLEAALAAEGMTLDDLERVPVPNFARGVELMKAGRVAGAFTAPGSGVIRQADADIGVRFIGITPKPNGEKAAQKVAPGSYLVKVEPTGANAGVKEPITMLGYEYTLMVGNHVPDEVVYKVVKALHENKAALAQAHAVYKRWDPNRIYAPLDAPYHPGARKYYEEVGLLRR